MIKISNNYIYRAILCFVFSIPLSQYLSVRVLMTLVLFSFFIERSQDWALHLAKNSWDIFLYMLVLVFGLLYSEDLTTGLKILETGFSLCAIPVVFSRLNFDKNQFDSILMSFVVGLLMASTICLIVAIISFLQTNDMGAFFYYQLTETVNLQPTYFAYYLCFAISFMLYTIHYERLRISVSLTVVSIAFMFIVLMMTAGRTAYIGMLLIFSFFILKFFFDEGSNFNKSLSATISSSLLVIMLLVNYYDLNAVSNGILENNDYWERLTLWESALKANPDLIFGVGTGDFKTALNVYYNSHNLVEYADESLNSHNQFIQSFFSNGVLGLGSIFLLLGRPLYLSVIHQNVLGIFVFFSFLIYGITEVFLGRYQGVVFFGLMHQSFIAYYHGQTRNALGRI